MAGRLRHDCPYCAALFARSEELTDHVLHHHPEHVLSFLLVEPHDLPER